MKVLFVTRKYPPRVGGMENLSYELTVGFPEPKTLIALRGSQKHLVWFLPYALLRVAFTAHRYDLVHLGDALLASLAWAPRRIWKRPVVVSVHGLDLTFRPWVYQTYLKWFLRADAFVANSESTKRLALDRGLSNVKVITIGAPTRYFSLSQNGSADPELESLRRGRLLLLTVGRLVPRKGVAWFVREVLPQLGDVLYAVIGEGAERDAILRAASDTGTLDRLWLVGRTSDSRLLALLASADVFVMPNVRVPGDVEGFGIVAIEAAASGLPVVAARLEGIPDAICHGENGILIEPGDAAGFVRELRHLADNSQLRREMGERARAYTREHNAWDRIIQRYVAQFSEIVQAPVGRGARAR